MSERNKTLIYLAVTALLMLAAFLATRPRSLAPETFDDQGQAFFADFTDPLAATSLEVDDWDDTLNTARRFKVEFKDGAWTIPSHSGYPADARDRLARTAGGIIALRKDTIRSDRPEDHKDLGVLDPLDPKLTSGEGVGKRITLRDKAGNPLADFILGKEIPGRTGQRFVRKPDQNRVYGVAIKSEPSSRFADWIEPGLLKLEASSIRTVLFDNHRVDPERQTIEYGEVFELERKDASSPWTLRSPRDRAPIPIPPNQELDTAKVSDLTFALSDLKIVGVRPKPPGLSAELTAMGEGQGQGMKLDRAAVNSLATRGFYLVKGELLSNLGEVDVTTQDGIVYQLRFGEITFAQGDALSAGSKEEDEPAKQEGAEKKENEKDQTAAKDSASKDQNAAGPVESRFLFVTATFRPELIPKPAERTPGEIPDDPFQRTPAEREAREKADKEKAEREQAEYNQKIEAGKTKAAELARRFAPWYYVVPGDAYRKIVLDRQAFLRAKAATNPGGTPPDSSLPPGFPPLGGGLPGLPAARPGS
jgi:hypothetical protein